MGKTESFKKYAFEMDRMSKKYPYKKAKIFVNV